MFGERARSLPFCYFLFPHCVYILCVIFFTLFSVCTVWMSLSPSVYLSICRCVSIRCCGKRNYNKSICEIANRDKPRPRRRRLRRPRRRRWGLRWWWRLHQHRQRLSGCLWCSTIFVVVLFFGVYVLAALLPGTDSTSSSTLRTVDDVGANQLHGWPVRQGSSCHYALKNQDGRHSLPVICLGKHSSY